LVKNIGRQDAKNAKKDAKRKRVDESKSRTGFLSALAISVLGVFLGASASWRPTAFSSICPNWPYDGRLL
jgi:hypothetical protein